MSRARSAGCAVHPDYTGLTLAGQPPYGAGENLFLSGGGGVITATRAEHTAVAVGPVSPSPGAAVAHRPLPGGARLDGGLLYD